MSISVTQQTPDYQPVNIKITYQTEVAILARLFAIVSEWHKEDMADLIHKDSEWNEQYYIDLQQMFIRLKNSLNNYVEHPL